MQLRHQIQRSDVRGNPWLLSLAVPTAVHFFGAASGFVACWEASYPSARLDLMSAFQAIEEKTAFFEENAGFWIWPEILL